MLTTVKNEITERKKQHNIKRKDETFTLKPCLTVKESVELKTETTSTKNTLAKDTVQSKRSPQKAALMRSSGTSHTRPRSTANFT